MDTQKLMQEFKQIEKDCNKKMKAGQAQHGEYDPETDKRDFFDEILEELYDSVNYHKMMIIRVKYLKQKYYGDSINRSR